MALTKANTVVQLMTDFNAFTGTVNTNYLLKTEANTTYLKKAEANTTYLKKSEANTTYLKKTEANSTYLKVSTASNTYQIKVTGTASNTVYHRGDGKYAKINATDITAGTVPVARIGTNTAANTRYLRGDNFWAEIPTSSLSTFGYNVTTVNQSSSTSLTAPIKSLTNVQFSSAAQTLTLPAMNNANSPVVGWPFEIYNTGSNSFTVNDSSGNPVAIVQPSSRAGLILIDNSTAAGTFNVRLIGGIASTSDFWTGNNGYKQITTGLIPAATAWISLTDASTIAIDLATGLNFAVTLGANRSLGFPTNTSNCIGRSGLIKIKQDATGNRTLNLSATGYVFDSDSAPVITTTANKTTILTYTVIDTNRILLGMPAKGVTGL